MELLASVCSEPKTKNEGSAACWHMSASIQIMDTDDSTKGHLALLDC